MTNSGDAAEQIVRMSLEGTEVALRLIGSAAKNIAAALYTIAKNADRNKTKGYQRLDAMLKSGKELKNTFKNNDHPTEKLPMPHKVKRGFRFYCTTVLAMTLVMGLAMPVSAANGDPLTVVNNLSDFIFGMIRAVGLILLGWGIVQVGLSLQSHDPSQRSNGFLTLAGGIIITFAKEILTMITG